MGGGERLITGAILCIITTIVYPMIPAARYAAHVHTPEYIELLTRAESRAAMIYGDKKEPLAEEEREEWIESIGEDKYPYNENPHDDSLGTFLSLSEKLIGDGKSLDGILNN